MGIMARLWTLLLCTMFTLSTVGSAEELVEDAGMVDLEEFGGQVVLAGGTVVTLVTKAKKCIRKAALGDNLSVHYTGRLDGPEGKIFDTSKKETPMPFKFQLGANRVIQGYEKGVPGMCRGETRTLLVPPGMGYGDHGVPNVIPGGATLHFTVELLSISDGPPLPITREL